MTIITVTGPCALPPIGVALTVLLHTLRLLAGAPIPVTSRTEPIPLRRVRVMHTIRDGTNRLEEDLVGLMVAASTAIAQLGAHLPTREALTVHFLTSRLRAVAGVLRVLEV
jgi:hypothetical protein